MPTAQIKIKPSIFLKGAFALFLLMALLAPFSSGLAAQDNNYVTDDAQKLLDQAAQQAGATSGERPVTAVEIIGDIIKVVLGFVGVIFLALVIYGGFTWMTAGGNEERVSKAATVLKQSGIGMAAIIIAFLITTFVVNALIETSRFEPAPNLPPAQVE